MSEPSAWAMEKARELVCDCGFRGDATRVDHDGACPAVNTGWKPTARALDAARLAGDAAGYERGAREERERLVFAVRNWAKNRRFRNPLDDGDLEPLLVCYRPDRLHAGACFTCMGLHKWKPKPEEKEVRDGE